MVILLQKLILIAIAVIAYMLLSAPLLLKGGSVIEWLVVAGWVLVVMPVVYLIWRRDFERMCR